MSCPHRGKFCLVCGLFTPNNKQVPLKGDTLVASYQSLSKSTYSADLWYVPPQVCLSCHRDLYGGNKNAIAFSKPTIWKEREIHEADDCYFCLNYPLTKGRRYETRTSIPYRSHPSVIPPVKRAKDDRKKDYKKTKDPDQDSDGDDTKNDPDFTVEEDNDITLFSQALVDNLARDLRLGLNGTEVLGSALKQMKCVTEDFRVTDGRDRNKIERFDVCYSIYEKENIIYCNDVDGLFSEFGYAHKAVDWRLFLDSSKHSLKVVLLHNGNKLPTVPLAFSTATKETYAKLKKILDLLQYTKHKWQICCDLKVVAILMGLRGGNPTHSCYLCLWQGRQKHLHYIGHYWSRRVTYEVDYLSVDRKPLVDAEKIIIPPLHVKLGLVKNFLKAVVRKAREDIEKGRNTANSEEFLKQVFPKLSAAKIKEGIKINSHEE